MRGLHELDHLQVAAPSCGIALTIDDGAWIQACLCTECTGVGFDWLKGLCVPIMVPNMQVVLGWCNFASGGEGQVRPKASCDTLNLTQGMYEDPISGHLAARLCLVHV